MDLTISVTHPFVTIVSQTLPSRLRGNENEAREPSSRAEFIVPDEWAWAQVPWLPFRNPVPEVGRHPVAPNWGSCQRIGFGGLELTPVKMTLK